MPRDSGGTYFLSPAGNPVVSGTIIQSSWANPTMDDLAAALTDSLSRTGQGNMLVPFRVPDGSAVAPSFSFLNNVLSGLYLFAANDVRMSVNGVDLARFENGKIQQWDATGMQWIDILGTIDAHIANATGAHAASAISVVPFDDIVAIEVQAALEEVRATTSSEVPVLYQGNTTNPLVDLKLKNTIDFQGVGTPSFTRASSATYVDRYGVVQYSEGGSATNLVLQSQTFDNASWQAGTFDATVTPNSIVAPDGTVTADLLDDTSAVNSEICYQSFTFSDLIYTFSVYLKQGSSPITSIAVVSQTIPFAAAQLSWGTLSITNSGAITSKVETLHDGWVKLSITMTVTAGAGGGNVRVYPTSTIATDTGTVYAWGAQLGQSNFANGYVKTTTTSETADVAGKLRFEEQGALLEGASTNLALRSEEFDNAVWNPVRASATPNAATAPDGATTAYKLVEDSSNNSHFLSQGGITVVNGSDNTSSIFVKSAGDARQLKIQFLADTSGAIVFDPDTGLFDLGSGTAKLLADDWWRVSFLLPTTTGTSSTYQLILRDKAQSGTDSYQGDGASGVYIWGAGLEQLEFASSYIPTVASPVARAGDDLSISGINNLPKIETGTPLSLVVDFDTSDTTGANTGLLSAIGVQFCLFRIAGDSLQYFRSGSALAITTVTANTPVRAVITVDPNNATKGYADGVETGAGTFVPNTPGIATTINIGNEASNNELFGHISRLQIFAEKLSDFEASIV